MEIPLQSLTNTEGSLLRDNLDKLSRDPHKAQQGYLFKILKANSFSEYGREHNFAEINNEKEFQEAVPVNNYQDLEPYIKKISDGHKNILTSAMPVRFNLTSGTSDQPKYIPVTVNTRENTSSFMHQWLHRTLRDHPSFLDKAIFFITSAAVEGHTASGIPCGSISGMIYKDLPRSIQRSYVLPKSTADIKNYDLRYYIIARLALGRDISFVATPNPATLIKVADIGIKYQERIIRSIHDGCISVEPRVRIEADDLKVVDALNLSLQPDPSRARFLSEVIKTTGRLLPYSCWPSLELIGCWLGGSIGHHADKLSTYYGSTPKRDIGYLASEGVIALPYEDNTPAGILALQNNYYEFIPEDEVDDAHHRVVLSHELESGRYYKVLLTNESGLYRYDIGDIIRVEKFYHKTPVIAFVRKTREFLNIMGEKLHANHILMALKRVQVEFDISITQFRVVANQAESRYDIFVQLYRAATEKILGGVVLPAIDAYLSEINIEYSQKRASKRLDPPCLHVMDSAWEREVKKKALESGQRDVQYKWQQLAPDFLEIDKNHIAHTVAYRKT